MKDELIKVAEQREELNKKWEALPEEEKERTRKELADWADRIDSENETMLE